MKTMKMKSRKGSALAAVVIFTVIFTILGFSGLYLAQAEVVLTHKEVSSTKAFYLAEAGLAKLTAKLYNEKEYYNIDDIDETELGEGAYQVEIYDDDPPYAISTGTVRGKQQKIRVELSFLARPYEDAIYAGNASGQDFTLALRGQGLPISSIFSSRETGGKDMVNGNIFADGDVALFEESSINPAPLPNAYGLSGDVDATGNINILDSAAIAGDVNPNAAPVEDPDLISMNYHINNTHNVAQLFADEGVASGRLPWDHELYNVLIKNPSDRASEIGSTVGDDYFLEPVSVNNDGADSKDAKTLLDMGENRIYYVDGDVWIHSPRTYGFLLDGSVTIVATGDIHISDNTKYADSQSMLGLVALGKHDDYGQLVSGGNIYFGDPRFGTTYTVSAFMFAANDFLYNTDSITGGTEEPQTGFSVFGNFSALNQVSIFRDWYDDSETGQAKPAYFDPKQNLWLDVETGHELRDGEVESIRHYQMQVSYDDRLRNPDTQPPGLPRGGRAIFSGLTRWMQI